MKSLGKGVVTWSYQQYRENAKKEYSSFFNALVRELIQNSNDAGATIILFKINKTEGILEVMDDGKGMTLDIIQNKLLVIGGSAKDEGSVGGLGKAKEILFFSQPHWTIETLDHKIVGQGGEYEIFESSTHTEGTLIRLHQPTEDLEATMNGISTAIRRIAARCTLKAAIAFLEDGQEEPIILEQHRQGTFVRPIEEVGNLYYISDKDGTSSTIMVKVNGCWMFNVWVSEYRGQLVVDIDPQILPPTKGLTANRDSLKGKYSSVISSLIEGMVVQPHQVLRTYEPSITFVEGEGSILVEPPSSRDMSTHIEMAKRGLSETSSLAALRVLQILSLTDKESALVAERELERFSRVFDFKPRFVVYQTPEDELSEEEIKSFLKTRRASIIINIWAETVRQVFIDNKMYGQFDVGFLWERGVEAINRMRSGEPPLYLINPHRVPPLGIQGRVILTNYMRVTAAHEVTHQEVSGHGERFIEHFHAIEAATWKSLRIYSAICKFRPKGE